MKDITIATGLRFAKALLTNNTHEFLLGEGVVTAADSKTAEMLKALKFLCEVSKVMCPLLPDSARLYPAIEEVLTETEQ